MFGRFSLAVEAAVLGQITKNIKGLWSRGVFQLAPVFRRELGLRSGAAALLSPLRPPELQRHRRARKDK